MEEKYLPIGSVVTVKGLNKKVMIIGYYSLEYQNSVKIYDYVGCNYPEGMLMKNNMFSFNHSDITNCDFVGFKDASYETLNKNLNSQLNTDTKDMEQPKNFLNLKFDENGVVVYEELSPVKKAPEVVKNTPVINPFEVKSPAPEAKSKTPVMKNDFVFDENGFVVEDNTAKENKKDIESNFKYTFDENGFVTGEEKLDGNTADTSTGEIQYLFDENGFVVGEQQKNATTEAKPAVPKYTFDEFGFVTGDSTVKEEPTPSKDTKPKSEKKDEYQMPHYRFDENGVIISE